MVTQGIRHVYSPLPRASITAVRFPGEVPFPGRCGICVADLNPAFVLEPSPIMRNTKVGLKQRNPESSSLDHPKPEWTCRPSSRRVNAYVCKGLRFGMAGLAILLQQYMANTFSKRYIDYIKISDIILTAVKHP